MSPALRSLLSLNPVSAAQKAASWSRRLILARHHARKARNTCTYPAPGEQRLAEPFTPRITVEQLAPLAKTIEYLSTQTLAHRFDVLGSGWVDASYGAAAPGFNGISFPTGPTDHGDLTRRVSPGNQDRASRLRDLVDSGFKPIDWHRDLHSGYRWRENAWSKTIVYGHVTGADIKGPWELARMQHLPWLAWAFILASAGTDGFQDREIYLRECRNQVLDFLASNPPSYGVNWFCTMDVAIRAANIALALDLFRAHGVEFDSGFSAEMDAAFRAHGRHIVGNLEWSPKARGNHYLANLCGLAFMVCALPRDEETDQWLAFATQELVRETEDQFNRDGSNFEGSTSYHRLSAEMVTYATAALMGLSAERRSAFRDYNSADWLGAAPLHPAPMTMHTQPNGTAAQGPFPAPHFRRLEKAADFSAHITKSNGRVAQIGDNDSGRFFKIAPVLIETPDGLREEHLSHRGLVGAINGLFNRPDRADFASAAGALETHLVGGLAKTELNSYRESGSRAAASGYTIDVTDIPGMGKARSSLTTTIRVPDPAVLENLNMVQYADFGLYMWVSKRLFLAVRCGPGGTDGKGGHAHNDQLSIELTIDGEDWIADPGSFTYTADLRLRNAYRSVRAHSAPHSGRKEPAPLNLGPFRLPDRAKAVCHGFQATEFSGVHYGFGFAQVRTIAFEDGAIVISDTPGDGIKGQQYATVHTPAEARAHFGPHVAFSPGYGLRDTEES